MPVGIATEMDIKMTTTIMVVEHRIQITEEDLVGVTKVRQVCFNECPVIHGMHICRGGVPKTLVATGWKVSPETRRQDLIQADDS